MSIKKSTQGYKRNSPDRGAKKLRIPSNMITMDGVDFPVLGVDNLGNQQVMYPGNDYVYPGSYVDETPIDVQEPSGMAKDGKWIQKAINPKHKGYCTPMTKKTCTPRRKALARTFKKHHGFHEDGGSIPNWLTNKHSVGRMAQSGVTMPNIKEYDDMDAYYAALEAYQASLGQPIQRKLPQNKQQAMAPIRYPEPFPELNTLPKINPDDVQYPKPDKVKPAPKQNRIEEGINRGIIENPMGYGGDETKDYYTGINKLKFKGKHKPTNIGKSVLDALMFVDAVIPPDVIKPPVVRPELSYNEHAYGTGSQAIAKHGKEMPCLDCGGKMHKAQMGTNIMDMATKAIKNNPLKYASPKQEFVGPAEQLSPQTQEIRNRQKIAKNAKYAFEHPDFQLTPTGDLQKSGRYYWDQTELGRMANRVPRVAENMLLAADITGAPALGRAMVEAGAKRAARALSKSGVDELGVFTERQGNKYYNLGEGFGDLAPKTGTYGATSRKLARESAMNSSKEKYTQKIIQGEELDIPIPDSRKDIFMNFISNPTRHNKYGGKLPKAQMGMAMSLNKLKNTGPTTEDSLLLYNNQLKKDAFYRKNKNYFTDRSFTNNKDIPSLIKELSGERDSYYSNGEPIPTSVKQINESFPTKITPSQAASRFGRVKGNVYSSADILVGHPDSYFNPAAPPSYFSDKILPTSWVQYYSSKYEDVTDVPMYNPLNIKPYNMLTPSEKAIRDKKPGKTNISITANKMVPKQPTENKKIVPNIRPDRMNMPDTSYGLPARARMPERRIASNTPTKWSFTYPTGPYNEQKTIYFPDQKSWKSFIKNQKTANSQETSDQGTATGYMEMGGNMPYNELLVHSKATKGKRTAEYESGGYVNYGPGQFTDHNPPQSRRYGGTTKRMEILYEEGGTYDIPDEEIKRLIAAGYQLKIK